MPSHSLQSIQQEKKRAGYKENQELSSIFLPKLEKKRKIHSFSS